MSILKFRKSEHASVTIPEVQSNKSEWFKYGYKYVEGAAVNPPTNAKDIEEWNSGVLAAVNNIGFEEHSDPFVYYDKLSTFDGSKPANLFDKPIVIQPLKETRVEWASSDVEGAPPIRDKVLFVEGPESEGGNPNGFFSKTIKIGDMDYAEIAHWGFLSVFEKDISDSGAQNEVWDRICKEKKLEDIREFNLGVAAGIHYKKTGKIDEKTIEKLRNYINGKVEVKSVKEEKKKETTTMTTAATTSKGITAVTAAEESTLDRLKSIAKTKGTVVLQRTAARQINKGLKDLVISKLSETGKNAREIEKLKSNLAVVFSTPFGDAILGILASQVIPFAAKAVGQENNPHVAAIAEECGLEGTVQVADMMADMLRNGVGELATVIQGALASIPADAPASA
jgi:hypothetical protein